MNPVLFRFLFRRHGFWCALCGVIPFGLGVVMGLLYPLFDKERRTFGPVFKLVREWFRDVPDFLSPEGAFVWPFMHPMTLLSFIVAPATVVLAMPAGDRGRGALDLLLSRPISRVALVRTVALFLVPVSVWMALSTFCGALVGASLAGELQAIPVGGFVVSAIQASCLVLALGAVGLALSVRAADRGAATWTLVVFGVTSFVIQAVGQMWKGQEWIQRLSLLGYYAPLGALDDPGGALWNTVPLLAIVLSAFFWATRHAERRRSA